MLSSQVILLIAVYFVSDGLCANHDKDLNAKMDNFIRQIAVDDGNMLDPIRLPPADMEISKTISSVTTYGTINMTNGWLSGLRSLRRNSDFIITNQTGNLVTASGEVAVVGLLAKYESTIKVGIITINPNLNVEISKIRIKVIIAIDRDLKTATIIKEKLNIEDLKVKMSDFGPLNWILDVIYRSIEDSIKPQIEATVFQIFENVSSQVFKKIAFPF